MKINIDSNERLNTSISPVGWYLAALMHRFEVEGEDIFNNKRRCTAWKNLHLIKAENPEQAYSKAIELGKLHESAYINTDGQNVKWIFEGLTLLLAVYEELEDGAEIMWTEYENKAVKTIKDWVKTKEELEVFETN